jgi:methyl-accepting chemotaxis protein
MAEQATAAARSMVQESEQLSGMIGQFQLGRTVNTGAIRRELKKVAPHAFTQPAKAPSRPASSSFASRPRPARTAEKMVVNGASAGAKDEGWNEF